MKPKEQFTPDGAGHIYREAALLMEEANGGPFKPSLFSGSGWTCIALKVAAMELYGGYLDERGIKACNEFRAVFDENFGPSDDAKCRDHRILSLCLMADMLERP